MAFPLRMSMTCVWEDEKSPPGHSLARGVCQRAWPVSQYVKVGTSLPLIVPQSLLLSRPHTHTLTGSLASLDTLAHTHARTPAPLRTHTRTGPGTELPKPPPPPPRILTRRLRATMRGVSL